MNTVSLKEKVLTGLGFLVLVWVVVAIAICIGLLPEVAR